MLAISVFTPTFNRAATLARAHDSLLRQTLDPACFEWIIVDDGSTDGTRELVGGWMNAPFPIRYSWQPNAGKHVAWNRAVADARGELFTVIDSDDGCVPRALERFVSIWADLTEARRRELGGILVRCETASGTPIGPPLPNVDTADFAELAFLHQLPVETWTAMRTDVLASNPFPELRVPLLPEGALWHQIARRYKWLVRDECLRVYFTAEHGRGDQLSRLSPWRYPAGMAFTQKSILDNSWRFFARAPVRFARFALHFDRFSLHAGAPIHRAIATLEHPAARALCWSVLPAAYALYAADRRRLAAEAAGS
jgi:Glycosyl transferase family 2